jgi:hypothetical protein
VIPGIFQAVSGLKTVLVSMLMDLCCCCCMLMELGCWKVNADGFIDFGIFLVSTLELYECGGSSFITRFKEMT